MVWIGAKLSRKFLLRRILLPRLEQQVTDGEMHPWQIGGDVLDHLVLSQSLRILLRILVSLRQKLMSRIRIRSDRE